MGLVLLGASVGLVSAIGCALAGDITLIEGALIYWIMGTTAPALRIAMGLNTPQPAH